MQKNNAQANLVVNTQQYTYWDLASLGETFICTLPYSLRILAENLLRSQAEGKIDKKHLDAFVKRQHSEIPFYPHRILMQDFTGVPAIADLSALRDAVAEAGGNPETINPQIPVDLVIDHSVQMDCYGSPEALKHNVEMEYQRNEERYRLLKWAQLSFDNLRIVPPNSGICHQVNLEYLSQLTVDNNHTLYPDSVFGTDSHTTMINGLGVLGWGVGGIEAEAAMLGEPYWMPIPPVVGVKMSGKLRPECTPTDIVLTVTELLRKVGVVGSFVEFYGDALATLRVADRAMIANMCPEYGATIGYFPIDERTVEYLHLTGRHDEAELTEAYAKANYLWYDPTAQIKYEQVLELDLATIEPSIAGPSRPQDRLTLSESAQVLRTKIPAQQHATVTYHEHEYSITDGAVAIAAITSCTNTSNPAVMLGAGLLARNAVKKGLQSKPWVKTTLAPGSRVVQDYLTESRLLGHLEALGFHIAAFGCGTCIGNSGPLEVQLEEAQNKNNLSLAAALSGNRNFEGRIHARVASAFLMSPPLVVAYALAGRIDIDFNEEPLGYDSQNQAIYLRDIWPDPKELQALITQYVQEASYAKEYANIFTGDLYWRSIEATKSNTYPWDTKSTYIAKPPFVDNLDAVERELPIISGARALLVVGDSVTTDHISPAGAIAEDSPAGKYLQHLRVAVENFNSYGSRRGNHEVMVRGTFANIRLKQLLSAPQAGGFTRLNKEGKLISIYDAAEEYQRQGVPTLVFAGSDYGAGSSRDWAAKGPQLLGVKAVIAQSYERIHRSNLIGMGILPLQFNGQDSFASLGLDGFETFDFTWPTEAAAEKTVEVTAYQQGKLKVEFTLRVRLDSPVEREYYLNGGILPYVTRRMLEKR